MKYITRHVLSCVNMSYLSWCHHAVWAKSLVCVQGVQALCHKISLSQIHKKVKPWYLIAYTPTFDQPMHFVCVYPCSHYTLYLFSRSNSTLFRESRPKLAHFCCFLPWHTSEFSYFLQITPSLPSCLPTFHYALSLLGWGSEYSHIHYEQNLHWNYVGCCA